MDQDVPMVYSIRFPNRNMGIRNIIGIRNIGIRNIIPSSKYLTRDIRSVTWSMKYL